MQQYRTGAGFSLIELMIVVAVVAILAAIGYPAYLDQTRKAHRADAQALLMTVADRQQQFLLDTRAYAASTTALQVQVPQAVAQHYTVAVALGTDPVPTFTATATPVGHQAADKCGVLSLTQAGIRSPAGCW